MHLTNPVSTVVVLSVDEGDMAALDLAAGNGGGIEGGLGSLAKDEGGGVGVLEVVPFSKVQAHEMRVRVEMGGGVMFTRGV